MLNGKNREVELYNIGDDEHTYATVYIHEPEK